MENVRESLQEAFQAVKGTMENTIKSVEETVSSVKGTVGDAVDAVKHFDVREVVENHPWLCIGGCVALGYWAYHLLEAADQKKSQQSPGSPAPVAERTPVHHGNGRHRDEEPEPASARPTPRTARSSSKPENWEEMVGDLKALAIGVPLSIIRDKLATTGAEAFRSQINELMNALTEKLGGKVIQDAGEFAG